MSEKLLGLIAGNGKFPIAFAKEAKAKGYRVVASGIEGDTSYFLRFFVDSFCLFKAGELKRLFSYLKKHGVQDCIMAGQVNPNNLFDARVELDTEFKKIFQALKDRKADSIFAAVADRLEAEGLRLIDSTFLLEKHLAPKGVLTHRAPTLSELSDVEFGRTIAKVMGGVDVGQSVVVREKAIVAIEAMEGTDQTILRGGRIAKEGAVIIKMSKPQQDLRFDVPVIGPRTVRAMIKANAKCLAIEAGKTLIIDRAKTVKLANKAKICIMAA